MLSPDDYTRHDATALATLVANGDVTADELLDAALSLAREHDPALGMLVHVDEALARRRIAAGLPGGPFRGVPFLLKDLGAESVDFPSSGGSRLLADTRYARDSSIVERLNAAGLVTFGRTTAPEGGVGPVTEAAVYGHPTRNPWDRSRTPGGSSGGAAAAVASGVVPAAHGSDGGGSIRIPASCCGLFGFKATRARVPDGPYAGEGWAGMAIDGFLTRSVRDSAALLDAVAGPDPGAPYHPPPLRGTLLGATGTPPPRLRVGLLDTRFDGTPIEPEVREAVLAAASLLGDLGHHVEPFRPAVDVPAMMQAWTDIVACGTALWIERALAREGRTLVDGDVEPLARSAREHARSISGTDYLAAVETVHAFGRDMEAAFAGELPAAPRGGSAASGIDVLLCATLAEPPARIGRFDHSRADYVDYRLGPDGVFAHSPFTAIFNASGQPAASLPLHVTESGLPVGVHLACAFGEDERLLSLCAEIETAAPWFERRPPATR